MPKVTSWSVAELAFRLATVRLPSTVLVQPKGTQRSIRASMKVRIASAPRRTEVTEARRMSYRVMTVKNDSTRFIQDEWVGLTCGWIRGSLASQVFTSGWSWAESLSTTMCNCRRGYALTTTSRNSMSWTPRP